MGQSGHCNSRVLYFFMEKRKRKYHREKVFVGDRMSNTELRGRWCNAIVLNVLAPTEEKSDDSKYRFMRN